MLLTVSLSPGFGDIRSYAALSIDEVAGADLNKG